MYVCVPCAYLMPAAARIGFGSSITGVTDCSEPPRRCWQNPGCLQGQHVLFTAEPALQPQESCKELLKHCWVTRAGVPQQATGLPCFSQPYLVCLEVCVMCTVRWYWALLDNYIDNVYSQMMLGITQIITSAFEGRGSGVGRKEEDSTEQQLLP